MNLDTNKFKQSVKVWIRENPQGSINDLVDYCEAQIPPAQFTHYQWLLEHTVSWYKHILASRDALKVQEDDEDSD